MRGSRIRLLAWLAVAAFPQPGTAAVAHDPRAQGVASAALPLKADPEARRLLLGARSSAKRGAASTAAAALPEYLVIGTPSDAELAAAGIEVVTRGPGFLTLRCAAGQLGALSAMPSVATIQSSRRLQPELDLSGLASGVVAAHGAASPPYPGYTGKNIVLGIVDTGVDWTHGDFRDLSNHSRVQYLWDQTDAAGPHPPLYPYGSEWTRANIEAPGVCREADIEGHGSHVLGIAAGNGAATGNGKPAYTYVGMAPEADIVAVKTDFSSTGVIDGVSWIFQKATQMNRDAVVNLSLGSCYGPHDGTDAQEIALDALSGPGRLIVKAAGNTGGEKRHGRVSVTHGHTATISWKVSAYTPSYYNYNYTDLDAWYSESDSLTLTLLSPNGQTLGPVPVGYYTPTAVSTPDGAVYMENGIEATQNGLRHVFVEVWDPQIGQQPAPGTWTLRLDNPRATGSARFDGWLAGYNLGDGQGTATMWANWDAGTDITTPGNAHKVITVGAYTTKACWSALGYGSNLCYTVNPTVGALAFFSSPGPTRDGRMKPDISAPGFGVASALSGSSSPPGGFTVSDGVHVIEQGTSMAAPHVAGALAVLLQKFPHMGPTEAMSRLAMGAVKDAAVGSAPNNSWGYGKLNMAGSLATPASVEAAALPRLEVVRMAAGPNPFLARTRISLYFARQGEAQFRILDVSGRVVRAEAWRQESPGARELTWDGRGADGRAAAAGVYWAEARLGSEVARTKLGLLR